MMRCTCPSFSVPGDDHGVCAYCERAEEEAEADERNEAHARDPDEDDAPPDPPYPNCSTPERCAGKGYCPREISCFN